MAGLVKGEGCLGVLRSQSPFSIFESGSRLFDRGPVLFVWDKGVWDTARFLNPAVAQHEADIYASGPKCYLAGFRFFG